MSRYSDRLGREEAFDGERRAAAMGAANPAFILRNWVAQVNDGGFRRALERAMELSREHAQNDERRTNVVSNVPDGAFIGRKVF